MFWGMEAQNIGTSHGFEPLGCEKHERSQCFGIVYGTTARF